MTFKLYRADGGITVLSKDDLVRMRDYYLNKADESRPKMNGDKVNPLYGVYTRKAEAINDILKRE